MVRADLVEPEPALVVEERSGLEQHETPDVLGQGGRLDVQEHRVLGGQTLEAHRPDTRAHR